MPAKLFRSRRFDASPRHRQIYSAYEIAYTAIDCLAAVAFVIGSIMFLYEDWKKPGTWLFIGGSICFALRPAVRLARELHLAGTGHRGNNHTNTRDPSPSRHRKTNCR